MSTESARLGWALGRARVHVLSLVADVADELGGQHSTPAEHPPAWIIGHLILGDVYLLHLLDVERLGDDFQVLLACYGPESTPMSCEAGGDRLSMLAERLRVTGLSRDRAIARLSPADLARPTPDAVLARAQPTVAHHLQALVNHEGYHAGELVAWRRARGLPPVPWTFSPRA